MHFMCAALCVCSNILCGQHFKQHLIIYAAKVRYTELSIFYLSKKVRYTEFLWKKVYAHYVIDEAWNMNLLLQNLNHKNIVKYLGSLKTKTHLHIILE
jgi:hypothetical protein